MHWNLLRILIIRHSVTCDLITELNLSGIMIEIQVIMDVSVHSTWCSRSGVAEWFRGLDSNLEMPSCTLPKPRFFLEPIRI